MQLALEVLAMIWVLLSLGSCVSQVPVPSAELKQQVLMQQIEHDSGVYFPSHTEPLVAS